MSFREVESYPRQAQLEFFRRAAFPFYSITFELEASRLIAFAKDQGHPVYLSLCYFMTKAIQPLEDFRYRLRQGRLVLWEELHFGMTVPGPESTFGFCHFDYRPETSAFYAEAKPRLEASRRAPSMETLDRPNEIHFTAIPDITFTSFTHVPPDDPEDGALSIAFGRFRRLSDSLWVPVAVQANHVFIDGQALGRLAQAAQGLYDAPG